MAMAVNNQQHMSAVVANPATVGASTIRNLNLDPSNESLDVRVVRVQLEAITFARANANTVFPGATRMLGIGSPLCDTTIVYPNHNLLNPVGRHSHDLARQMYGKE